MAVLTLAWQERGAVQKCVLRDRHGARFPAPKQLSFPWRNHFIRYHFDLTNFIKKVLQNAVAALAVGPAVRSVAPVVPSRSIDINS